MDLSKEAIRKTLIKNYLCFKQESQKKFQELYGQEKAKEMLSGFKYFSNIWLKPYGLIDILYITIEKKSIFIEETNDYKLFDCVDIDVFLVEEGIISYESFGRLLKLTKAFRLISEDLNKYLIDELNLDIEDKKIKSGNIVFNIIGKEFDISSDCLFLYDYFSVNNSMSFGFCLEKNMTKCFQYRYNPEFDKIEFIHLKPNSIINTEDDFEDFADSLRETIFDYKNNQKDKDIITLNKCFGIKEK